MEMSDGCELFLGYMWYKSTHLLSGEPVMSYAEFADTCVTYRLDGEGKPFFDSEHRVPLKGLP